MKSFQKYIVLFSFCVLLLASCNSLPPYKIINQSDTLTEVELETRADIDDLHGIAREVRAKGKGTVEVKFMLPSEYPGSQNPWAQLTYLRISDTREQTRLTVYGACTNKHRDSLLGVTAGPGYQPLGKWHVKDPLKEMVLLIKQKDATYTLQRHRAGQYLETDHEPLPVSGVWADDRGVHEMKAPAFIINDPIDVPLTRMDAHTYQRHEGEEPAVYRIQPDGNLVISDSLGKPLLTAVKVP